MDTMYIFLLSKSYSVLIYKILILVDKKICERSLYYFSLLLFRLTGFHFLLSLYTAVMLVFLFYFCACRKLLNFWCEEMYRKLYKRDECNFTGVITYQLCKYNGRDFFVILSSHSCNICDLLLVFGLGWSKSGRDKYVHVCLLPCRVCKFTTCP